MNDLDISWDFCIVNLSMRLHHYFRMVTPLLLSLSSTRSFMLPRIAPISTSSLIMRSRKNTRVDDSLFDVDSYGGNKHKTSPQYIPRTSAQGAYVNALENRQVPIVFGIGPAGCGKTLFACLTAVKQLRAGEIKKIILTRPIVPVEEEEIGFLPGNLVKKMDPWTRPIFDILLEFYPQRDLDNMIQSGIIEISPLAFMRGRTFKHSFVIADEMQNSTPNQMMMLTTRIGDDSKMVITGDLKQTDRSKIGNGLSDLISKVEAYQSNSVFPIRYKKDIEIVRMNASDVQRHPIVTRILDIYQYKQTQGDFISELTSNCMKNCSGNVVDTCNKNSCTSVKNMVGSNNMSQVTGSRMDAPLSPKKSSLPTRGDDSFLIDL